MKLEGTDFSLGDVVRTRIPGPQMIVSGAANDVMGSTDYPALKSERLWQDGYIACFWFDRRGVYHQQAFHHNFLQLVVRAPEVA